MSVDSNSVTIDRTPPELASATITNSSPTSSAVFGLTYGAVTNPPYARYCILENSTSVGSCSWQAGALPATFTVSAGDGLKTLSVWIRDTAGNTSLRVSTAAVMLDQTPPTVTFSNPAAGSTLATAGLSAVTVNGSCSENGRNVVISGAASATVVCTALAWTANLDFTAASDGTVTILANHSDSAGNAATQASRSFVKDTAAPTVAISTPAAGTYIGSSGQAAFSVTGTCSENGRNVVITGDASATVACAAGAWSVNLDFSAAAAGTVTILVNHADAAGNNAAQASRSFLKDVTAPTVAITSPAAGSYMNAGNASSFAVSGTCSENGRNVVLSGGASGTVACAAGAWSINLDFSAAADGAVTLYANHSDAAGNTAVQASRSFTKDVVLPTVAISAPAAGSTIFSGNVSAFTVNGTCSENTRNVVITGDASATVACAAGAWSVNLDFSAASDGPVSITVNHSDAAGNAAVAATRNFTKNTGIPSLAITSPAAGSYVNIANVAAFPVSGTCSANGQNVVITGDASATIACAAGAWSTNLDFSGAAAGAVSIAVDHSDSLGNAAVTQNRSFTKDVVAPTVTISTPAAGSYVNAGNVTAFAVTGTCSENGRNIVITGDATATVTCTAGAWSASLDFSAAGAGAVTIDVNHSDVAGNPAVQQSRSFTKDSSVPTLAISTPAAGSSLNAGNVAAFAVTGSCSENGRNVAITGDASATVSCTAGAWNASLDFSAAAQGSVTIDVNHSDVAGNAATQQSRTFTKDTNLPTVAITSPAAGAWVYTVNMGTFPISGTCSENGRNVVLSGAGSATVACAGGTWSTTIDLTGASDGSITIYADHSDAAGNNATQASRSFNKDTGLPTLTIASPAAGSGINAGNVASFSVTGTCSENGQNVVITGDASATVTCLAGAWIANLDFTAASAGTVTINANHSDTAGNAAVQQTRSFTKDVTAPTVAITSPAAASYANASNYASFTVSGSCSENGRTVSVSAGAGAVTAAPTCAALAWTTNLDLTSISDGAFTVLADHDDAAGNTATQASRSFNKDIVAPASPTISIAGGAATTNVNPVALTLSATAATEMYITNVGGCTSGGAWEAYSTSKASWTLGQTNATATVYVKYRDAALNESSCVNDTIAHDDTLPTVAITSPAAASYANAASFASFTVSGTCSENTRAVNISAGGGAVTASPTCTAGAWSTTLDLTAISDGAFTVTADHSDAASNTAVQATRSFNKDIVAPTSPSISIAGGAATTNANPVALTLSAAGTPAEMYITNTAGCGSGGAWETYATSKTSWTLGQTNATATVYVKYRDAALNESTCANDTIVHDDTVPSVAITSPATNSYVNISNHTAFTVAGTCSETGRAVSVSAASGAITASPTCSGGNTWTTDLDFTPELNNGTTPKYANIVGYWKLNGTAGAIADAANVPATIGVNASAANTNSSGLAYVAGSLNQGISFDGVDDHVVIPGTHGYSFGTGAFSVSLWFNKNSNATRGDLFTWKTAGGGFELGIFVNYDTIMVYGDPEGLITGGAPVTMGQWHHLVLTRDNSSNAKIYVDGALYLSFTYTGDLTNLSAVPIWIGSNHNNSAQPTFLLAGKMDDVAVWDTSLSAAEARAIFSEQYLVDGNLNVLADHSDAAGNNAVQATRAFIKDTTPATVTISTPAASAYITQANYASYAVTGTCTENGRDVVISGDASATVTCTALAWTANLDFTAAAEGGVTISVNHSDAAGNPAFRATRGFVKDSVLPVVAISTPAANSYINSGNVTSYTVTGTCSENGRDVVISGDASATIACTAGAWSTNLDFSSASQGNVTIYADHADVAGNGATQKSRVFIKDTVAPVLASITVTNSTPTGTTTYSLTYGSITGTYADYCLLENTTVVGGCSWTAGTVPASTTVSGTNNSKTVSAYLRDAAGNVSAVVTSNAVVLDTTAASLASATITNTSPTNTTTYNLSYGAITDTYTQYCILENDTVVAHCSYTTGTLPSSFTVSATENTKVLSVWLKDSVGNVSTRVDTNSVTLDTSAPVLASATITNTSPSGSTTYNLSYGAVTGTYSQYCILENDTVLANCTFTTGTLPASFVVGSTQNSKVLSIWLKDTAANVSARVDTNAVIYYVAPPAIASVGNTAIGRNTGDSSTVNLSVTATGANNLLVVGASWCCNAGAPPGVTDNKGHVYKLAGAPIGDGSGDYVAIFYAIGTTAGVTTVSVSSPTGTSVWYIATIFSEYTNVNTSYPLDGFVSALTTGTAIGNSGAFTPNQSGDLLTVISNNDNDPAPGTAGAGFTLLTAGSGTDSYQGIAMEYRLYGSTAPVSGIVNYAVTYPIPTGMAAFRGTGALVLTPTVAALPVNGTQTFTAVGGLAPYTYSLVSGTGSINSTTGVYTAPASPTTDVVRVTDLLGNTSNVTVTVSSSFTNHWPFDAGTDSLYEISNTSVVELVGGVVRLKASDQLDDDNTASGFGGGTHSSTTWDATNGYVRMSQTGTPTNTAEFDSSWTPKWANIVGVWNFNEAAGASSIVDSSGNGKNGTPISVTSGGTGVQGKAVQGTASTSRITLPLLVATGDMSLSVWAKWYDTSAHGAQIFYTGTGSNGFGLKIEDAGCGTGNILGVILMNVTCNGVSGSYVMPTNVWTHLVLTRTVNTWRIYANGVLVDSGTATPITATTDSAFFNYHAFNGLLDGAAIWSTALSATDVATIYSRQSAKYSAKFTSRVMDSLAWALNWTTFSWVPTLPFFKQLPDYSGGAVQNETSTDYSSLVGSSGNIGDNDLMSGIVGLWHLDETSTGTAPGAKDFKDDSGNGNHGVLAGTATLGAVGLMGQAVDFNADGEATFPSTVNPWAGDFTISAWVFTKNPTCSGTCQIPLYQENYLTNGFRFGLYDYGLTYPVWKFWSTESGGTLTVKDTALQTPVNQWVHVVATYKLSTTTGSLYVNGKLVASGTGTIIPPVGGLAYGRGGSQPFKSRGDELAVWSRTLGASEIQQLYRRGGNRLKFQIRRCNWSTCGDDPTGANWKGPDGTNQTYFSELNNNTVALTLGGDVKKTLPSMLFSDFTNPMAQTEFFQYRAIMESDDPNTSCNYGSGATWCSPELKTAYADPIHYNDGGQSVVGKNGVNFYDLTGFAETLGVSCSSGVGYNLSYDKINWYWWDSTANAGAGGWVMATGAAAKSNSAAVIAAHASTFRTQAGSGTVYFKAFLKSSTGTTKCELSDVQIDGF